MNARRFMACPLRRDWSLPRLTADDKQVTTAEDSPPGLGLQNVERQARLRRKSELVLPDARPQEVRRRSRGGGMRMKTWFARGTLFALTVLMSVLMAAPAVAQVDTGTLLGTVKDQSGAVLPGATVTITHEGQGITLTTVTRADGTFIFTPIRTGAYTVETEFPGFKKGVRRGIPVAIQDQSVVDFSLEPGGVAEEVVVTGEAPLLQTGTGTV